MEIDDLKSDWNTVQPILKTDESLLLLLQENKHPVLKSIRKQIVIEVSSWLIFLLVYYSMFDGYSKPFWVNVVLVFSLLLPVLHSLYGYFYNKYLTDGTDIKKALERLYNRLKKYAFFSILSRIGFVGGLLFFFTYNIDFTGTKYFFLLSICFVFVFQIAVLYSIWAKRLKHIKEIIAGF